MRYEIISQIFLSILLMLCIPINAETQVLNNPECVAFDSVSNRYFATDVFDGEIFAIDSNRNQYLWGNISPSALALGCLVYDSLLFYSHNNYLIGLSLQTGDSIWLCPFAPPSLVLDGLAADTSGNLYAVALNSDKVYKIDPVIAWYSELVSAGLPDFPQEICYDARNDRLIAVCWIPDSPIIGIDCKTGNLTTLVSETVGYLDGVTIDKFGNVFVASEEYGVVTAYDSTFSNAPDTVVTGLAGPAGLYVNWQNNELVVPVTDDGYLLYTSPYVRIETDTTWGWGTELNVNFSGWSLFDIGEDWIWDFGDGDSAFIQNPTHTFNSPGAYEISLQILYNDQVVSTPDANYIFILADTMIVNAGNGTPGDTVEVIISANNTAPINRFVIPVEYGSGDLDVEYVGYSVSGCRTESFDSISYSHTDELNKRFTIEMAAGESGDLEFGQGTILKLLFRITSGSLTSQTVTIEIDGYNANYQLVEPSYNGSVIDYIVPTVPGEILAFICGDVNSDSDINLIDILYLIEYIYSDPPGPTPIIPDSGDVNSDSNVNLLDILYLIEFIYAEPSGPEPDCP